MGLYTHKTWASDEKILASQLNNIEDGIEAVLAPRYVVDQGGTKGTHATIQAAINAAEANGGGDVYILNNGTNFSISSSLVIDDDRVSLIGVGFPTLFAANGLDDSILKIGDGGTIYYDIMVRGIRFDGNRSQQTGTAHGIYCHQINKTKILNCVFDDMLDNGIELDDCDWSKIQGCHFDGGDRGIFLTDYSVHNIISICSFYNVNTACIDLFTGTYNIVELITFDGNSNTSTGVLESGLADYNIIGGTGKGCTSYEFDKNGSNSVYGTLIGTTN